MHHSYLRRKPGLIAAVAVEGKSGIACHQRTRKTHVVAVAEVDETHIETESTASGLAAIELRGSMLHSRAGLVLELDRQRSLALEESLLAWFALEVLLPPLVQLWMGLTLFYQAARCPRRTDRVGELSSLARGLRRGQPAETSPARCSASPSPGSTGHHRRPRRPE